MGINVIGKYIKVNDVVNNIQVNLSQKAKIIKSLVTCFLGAGAVLSAEVLMHSRGFSIPKPTIRWSVDPLIVFAAYVNIMNIWNIQMNG